MRGNLHLFPPCPPLVSSSRRKQPPRMGLRRDRDDHRGSLALVTGSTGRCKNIYQPRVAARVRRPRGTTSLRWIAALEFCKVHFTREFSLPDARRRLLEMTPFHSSRVLPPPPCGKSIFLAGTAGTCTLVSLACRGLGMGRTGVRAIRVKSRDFSARR